MVSLQAAAAREIWINRLGFRRRKIFTFLTSMKVKRKGIEIRSLFSLEMALTTHKKDLQFRKPHQIIQSEKYETFFGLQASNLKPKMDRRRRHGNLLVIVRRVSPGRKKSCVIWTKYAIPRQIKPRIFKLTTTRGQSNLSIGRTAQFRLPLVLWAQSQRCFPAFCSKNVSKSLVSCSLRKCPSLPNGKKYFLS